MHMFETMEFLFNWAVSIFSTLKWHLADTLTQREQLRVRCLAQRHKGSKRGLAPATLQSAGSQAGVLSTGPLPSF